MLTLMRQFTFVLLVLCVGIATSFAGVSHKALSVKPHLAVLLLAPPDLKAGDYVEIVQETFETEKTKGIVICGTPVQSKYQEYWLEKGQLEEGKITKAILHDFNKFLGTEMTLYICPRSVTEKTSVPQINPYLGIYRMRERTRASVEVRAFLVDNEKIINILNSTKNDDSLFSDLRAKRGAFRKAVRDIAMQMGKIYYRQKLVK